MRVTADDVIFVTNPDTYTFSNKTEQQPKQLGINITWIAWIKQGLHPLSMSVNNVR